MTEFQIRALPARVELCHTLEIQGHTNTALTAIHIQALVSIRGKVLEHL